MDSDFDNTLSEMQNLTQFEKQQLRTVMQQAKEFEKAEERLSLRKRIEGSLLKFTNVVKGYQQRWFVLNSEAGLLEYYEKEEHKSLKRRGELPLTFAIVTPSDEDSQTFSVSGHNGDIFKLRANDAKERQFWVNRIRAVAEFCSDQCKQLGNFNAASLPDIYGGCQACDEALTDHHQQQQHQKHPEAADESSKQQQPAAVRSSHSSSSRLSKSRSSGNVSSACQPQHQRSVRELTAALADAYAALDAAIGALPLRPKPKPAPPVEAAEASQQQQQQPALPPPSLSCLDRDLLAIRGAALAAVRGLEVCRDSLRLLRQRQRSIVASVPGDPLSNAVTVAASTAAAVAAGTGSSGSSSSRLSVRSHRSASSSKAASKTLGLAQPPGPQSLVPLPEMLEAPLFPVPHELDAEEPPREEEADLGSVEEHKSVILHLLQQLKLGMDLTRVVLPTFILEKRSLLEMFADSMLHPAMFLRAADLPDAEARMVAVLEWFLTSFHAGRKTTFSPKKGAIAKKPYNPLIGETFHCSWQLDDGSRLVYTAEQVSHHPPMTAFYLECPQKQVWLNASIYTKSKFMGMSIGVSMIGRLQLRLLRHGEVYNIQLPSAYARSILTVPWVELGDKVAITCSQSRYSASVAFHTKPFYGGRLHRVSAEARGPTGGLVCRVTGEWSGQLDVEWPVATQPTEHQHQHQQQQPCRRSLRVSELPVAAKRVRPLAHQRAYESRRVWAGVTAALLAGDIGRATEEKKKLEDLQRNCEKFRRDKGLQFPVKYFIKDTDGGWIFKQPLQLGQTTTVA